MFHKENLEYNRHQVGFYTLDELVPKDHFLRKVDKHTKISSEEISDGREYSLLFLYVKVVVSCKVVGLYGARRRLTNWQDTLF